MKVRLLCAATALLFSSAVLAQGMPGGGGPPPEGVAGGRPGADRPRPPRIISVDRRQLDEVVTAMFRQADSDRNGKVTLAELQAIVAAERAQIVAERFRAVDTDRNGAISAPEFEAWQDRLGMAAREERSSLVTDYVAAADPIRPPRGDSEEDRVLAMLIRPLNTRNLVAANVDYDDGVTIEELLSFERASFDAADADGDGKLSPGEIRALQMRREECGGPGGAGPGAEGIGFPGPPRNQSAVPTGAGCEDLLITSNQQ